MASGGTDKDFRWIQQWVVLPLLPLAFSLGFLVGRPDSASIAEALGHLGKFLGGYAALVAAVFAIAKGPQELAQWRTRLREEKMSEVAGECIEDAIRFGRALDEAIMDVFNDPHAPKLYDLLEKNGALLRFENARGRARAHLPPDAVGALERFDRILGQASYHQNLMRSGSQGHAGQAQVDLSKTRDTIAPTVNEVVAVLRKYTIGAHLDTKP